MKKSIIALFILVSIFMVGASSAFAQDSVYIWQLHHRQHVGDLYSGDANEVNVLRSRGWNATPLWIAPTTGTPVYRCYHPASSRHLYTLDKNEVEVICATQGWVKDNNGEPVFYSGGTVPIYRAFNIYNGSHMLGPGSLTRAYTNCPNPSYRDEGVKLYALGSKVFQYGY